MTDRHVHKWTASEQAMLWSDMSNEDISIQMNISPKAVRSARRYYTGHYCEPAKARYRDRNIEGEARIIELAHKIGARIEGVR